MSHKRIQHIETSWHNDEKLLPPAFDPTHRNKQLQTLTVPLFTQHYKIHRNMVQFLAHGSMVFAICTLTMPTFWRIPNVSDTTISLCLVPQCFFSPKLLHMLQTTYFLWLNQSSPLCEVFRDMLLSSHIGLCVLGGFHRT